MDIKNAHLYNLHGKCPAEAHSLKPFLIKLLKNYPYQSA